MVFIAVNIDSVETARIVGLAVRIVHGFVVIGHPVVRLQVKEVDFGGHKVMAIFVFERIGPTQCALEEFALADFGSQSDAFMDKGVFGFHRDNAVESVWSVKCRAGPLDKFYAVDVQFAGSQKVTQGKIETRCLVVYAVNQLQRAHGAGGVEPPCVDDGKPERGSGKVHAFQVAKAVIEVYGGGFFDGDGVEFFDGQG